MTQRLLIVVNSFLIAYLSISNFLKTELRGNSANDDHTNRDKSKFSRNFKVQRKMFFKLIQVFISSSVHLFVYETDD